MSWESPLLEREHETEVLQGSLARVVSSGSGRLVVIEGEAGLGKTRLLRHLRERAAGSGYVVLSARGAALERSFGFGVVRQLFEHAVARIDSGTTVAAAARSVVDPTAAVGPGDGDGPGELTRLHGLYWLLADLSREPTVLLVDDVHLADPESLRFLDHLRVRLDDLPVLVALAAGSDLPDAPSAVRTWRVEAGTTVVRPRPLGLLATARLITTLLGRPVDPTFAEACRRSTAGNPMLLTVLADVLAHERVEPVAGAGELVPVLTGHGLRDHVRRLLDQLPRDVRRVAEVVALLGDRASAGLVAEVVNASESDVIGRARELTERGLLETLTEDADPAWSYRHSLLAEAVSSTTPGEVRQRLGRRCADVHEARGASPEQVAAQVLTLSPGRDPRATGRLLQAAEDAERRGAVESAVGYLERCLREDLTPEQRLDVLITAGTVSLQLDLDRGVSFLERAVETAEGTDHPELWALLGTAYGSLRHPDAAVDAMEHAVRLLPPGDDDRRRHWEASLLVGATVAPGRHDLARRVDELRRLPPADGIGARLLDGILGFHEMAACDPHGATRAHRAVADGLLVERANGEGPLVCAWITLAAADDPLALLSLDGAVRQAQERGALRALSAALSFRALALLRAGRPGDAADDARVALGHTLDGRVDLDPRLPGAYLADALLETGELDEAEQTLRSVRAFTPDDGGPRYYSRDAVARLRRLQGRHGEALRIAEEAGAVWSEYGFDNPALGSWRSEAALASYALGQVDRAIALADEDLELARSWQAPGALGHALRVVGLVTGGEACLPLLEESVAVLETSPARVQLAHSLAALGAVLLRAGRRTAARDALSRALDLAQRCGARRLVNEVLGDLRRAGYRPRRHLLSGPESLTTSERRVAELAARGATNRAIAQLLFVSPKTVELHLTNAYRKLGVDGRHGLGPALAASDPA